MTRRKKIIVAVVAAMLGVGTAGVAWSATTIDTPTATNMQAICAAATTNPNPTTAAWAASCKDAMDGVLAASPLASPSPSDSPSPSPTPSPTAGPVLYPSPQNGNVGLPAGTTLTNDSRCNLATANEVITGKNFTCSHELGVTATNVTIKNSVLPHGINNWTAGGGHSFTLQDSTVGPASGCDGSNAGFGVGATDYTALRVLVRGIADGFRASGRTSNQITIQDSYVRVCTGSGDHSDGIQADSDIAPVLIKHNTIDQRTMCCTTANVFWPSAGVVTMDDNLLMAGGYTIEVDWSSGPNNVVTNNKLVDNSWDYGPSRSNCGHINWSGNVRVNIDSNYNLTSTGASVPCA